MSAGEVPLHQDGSHPPYVVWDTNMLPPSNVVEEGVFSPDVSGTTGDMTIGLTLTQVQVHQFNQFYNTYETFQLLNQPYDRGGLEHGSLVPGPSLIPTQLPDANQLDLSLMQELDLGGCSEADPQGTWEGEDDAMEFSTEPFEVQSLNTASSSSGSGTQRTEQRKPRKKEESGSCDVCSRSFSRRSDVRRHMNTAHGNEVHACPQCHIVCSRKDALRRHIRDQH